MQDKSTTAGQGTPATGGAKSGGVLNKRGEILFNANEILDFTKKAVNVLGIDYDTLEGTQKEAFVGQAIGCLTGVPPIKIDELYGKTDPAVTIEFRKVVLQEARNSPAWDQDEFVAGLSYDGIIGKTDNAQTEELHESRR